MQNLGRLKIRDGFLKRQRDLGGLTSEEAQARLLGVDRATLRRIDAGSSPNSRFIAAVCRTYGLGIGEAFEIVDDNAGVNVQAAAS